MKRHEYFKILKEKGIKFSSKMGNQELQALLDGETQEVPESVDKSGELVGILTTLTNELKQLRTEVDELKKPHEVFAIGSNQVQASPVEIQQTDDAVFLSQVPVNLLKTARDILGDKFNFECESLKDRPAFSFTVVVPTEYATVLNDRRTKIIDNALGANGVRDWCLLVKQNIIKNLGATLTKAL